MKTPSSSTAADAKVDAAVAPRRRRPVGVVLHAVFLLLGGLFLGGHALLIFSQILSTADGPVETTDAYKLALAGDGLLSLSSLVAAIGLFLGSRWGWCLAGLHWAWRLGREAVVPWVARAMWDGGDLQLDENTGGVLAVRVVFMCLMLLHLCRKNVLAFVRLDSINRYWAMAALIAVGIVIALFLDPLDGPLGFLLSNEVE